MSDLIQEAVKVLRRGGTVAFPTETVYGLGADATSPAAVQRVFAVKGRPSTNPVIVHVADAAVAKRYAATWPARATQLVEKFWPGPLTLVLPKTDAIVPSVTAGRNTVGLRAPDHPLTLELLRTFDGAIIGPSANRSSHVSPTTAQHVRDELGDAVEVILDGGPCRVGIESTVLDLSSASPAILRPGAISREQIEAVVGPVGLRNIITELTTPATSPGQHSRHYAPITPTYAFPGAEIDSVARWCDDHRDKQAILICINHHARLQHENLKPLMMPNRPDDYARQMYAALRHADRQSPAAIWIEMPPDTPEWLAVRDRLSRASRPAPR
ncbi:MAG TPA: L-threonylcarbamoyladenylate synthase [Tepidisphaeraceae bacterium]|jgi:L-threonylcarbamoyladenylate synthase